jgi:2-keto-4-pentenoate hydratase/2-oxohepta-3-ene-1,7-dioic acid hydratase in catechol pathway
MKYGRFEQQGRIFFGIVEGDAVQEIDAAPWDNYKQVGRRHALSSLKTLAPCIPANFYCAGLNYLEHLEWGNKRKGTATRPPAKADVGYRSVNALISTGETIVIPADSPGPVQYEGELVAVIGRKARNLSEANALSCVLGYTLGNDVSERGWQASDRTLWRAKNCDTFKPIHHHRARPDESHRVRENERRDGVRVSHRQDDLLGTTLHLGDLALHDAVARRRRVAGDRQSDAARSQARRRVRDRPGRHRRAA